MLSDEFYGFKSNDEGQYLVGYIDENKNSEIRYENKLKACADFLKHELDMVSQ